MLLPWSVHTTSYILYNNFGGPVVGWVATMPEHALQCMFVPDVINADVALLQPVFKRMGHIPLLQKVVVELYWICWALATPFKDFGRNVPTHVYTKNSASHTVSPPENCKIPGGMETFGLFVFCEPSVAVTFCSDFCCAFDWLLHGKALLTSVSKTLVEKGPCS